MSSLVVKDGEDTLISEHPQDEQGEDRVVNGITITSSNTKKESNPKKLSLYCTRMGELDSTGSPGSPDSDGDILGFLDYSPDAANNADLEASTRGHKFTPYSRVFEDVRFEDLMPLVYLRGQPITLKVADMDLLPSTLNFFNQCVFTVILHHGSTHWTVTKKSRQISSLHNQLRLFKTILKLPAATAQERDRRQSMRDQMRSKTTDEDEESEGPKLKTKRLVKFPRKSLQRMDRHTIPDVELYLNNLLLHSLLKSHCAVLEFFEISPLSFVRHLGPKMKEGFVKKRSGGRSALACCGGQYKRRWLVLKETCIFCLSPAGGNIRTVMLVDSAFQVSHGFRHTRITKGLLVTNLTRSLILKCDGEDTAREWSAAIEHIRTNYASDFSQDNRYLSFAPVRKRSLARWYVDGSWYMSDVADLLERAEDEIFITDWWLSPDIYMKRPDLTGKRWKLNEILKRQAARGVRVFILLYKEVELALGLNSLYSKQNLCQMSPNIKVLRHPDHYKGSLYWAHHEKMVIVDQMHAFVGGIDLCYGRWDDFRHKLVDVGHAGLVAQRPEDTSLGRLILNTHDIFTKGMANLPGQESDLLEVEDHTGADVGSTLPYRDSKSEPNLLDIDFCPSSHPTQELKTSEVENPIPEIEIHEVSNGQTAEVKKDTSRDVLDKSDVIASYCHEITMNGIVTEKVIYNDQLKMSPPKPPDIVVHQSEPSNAEVLFAPLCKGEDDSLSSKNSTTSGSDRTSTADDNSDVFVDELDDQGHRVYSSGSGGEAEDIRLSGPESKKILNGEEQKSGGRMTRNFKAVKTLGMDLVVEMKERKKEMKNWTEKKVPGFRRTNSFDSEMGLSTCSEEEEEEQSKPAARSVRLRRRLLKKRLKTKGRLLRESRCSSTGSLIDLHKELTYEDVNSVHLWLGKDYVNWITKDLYDPHIPFNDNVNRLQTPRMPWHDIALYVEGAAARDAARHFIERWNAVKSEKMKNNERYPYLIPKTYKPSSFTPSSLQPKHRVKCQVVRSLGLWSGGIHETERSIYNAYLDAIKGAKHFIYIENQFFISSASLGRAEVNNSIAYHLAQRIMKAHRNNQKFRVFVVLPLLPAFEGQIGTPSGVAMQYILHYTYETILRGPNSLIGVLESAGINWQPYLSFCSLRTHDVLEGQLVSEIIYIHSKLLIVDDRLVICGSANINDRSLLGSRDSEVALVIEDEEFCQGIMNGKEYRRGQFAGSLRMYLFSEHLMISGTQNSTIDISDPVSDNFFVHTWQGIASRNTNIYDEVFRCIPSDSVTTFASLKNLRSETPLAKNFPEKAKEKLKHIKGRLVLYPLQFLKDETLKPGFGNKESLLPIEMWV